MKANKEMLRSEYQKVWGDDERMVNYCTNKAVTMAILPDGGIVVVDKQRVEKDFCFGESGYDYQEAQDCCTMARNSQKYFLMKNMEGFQRWIADLEESKDELGTWWLHIQDTGYIRQTEDCKIRSIQFAKTTEILEETGPAFLHELFGKQVKIRGIEGHLATLEEIESILTAYKEAAADHEKKVRSYLKRFGTSKVHAWTYWRDE